MPVVKITRTPSLNRDTYDAVNEKVRIGADHPLGLLMHAAGEADGVFQVVEVWAAQEYAERFEADRLIPAIREVVGDHSAAGGSARAVIYETHYLVTP